MKKQLSKREMEIYLPLALLAIGVMVGGVLR